MAEIVGEITCPLCRDHVPLKKDIKQKYYYVCECGQHMLRGKKGADVALSVGKIYGAEKPLRNVTEKPPEKPPETPAKRPLRNAPPPPPAKPKPVTEKPPEQQQEPEKKTGLAGFFG